MADVISLMTCPEASIYITFGVSAVSVSKEEISGGIMPVSSHLLVPDLPAAIVTIFPPLSSHLQRWSFDILPFRVCSLSTHPLPCGCPYPTLPPSSPFFASVSSRFSCPLVLSSSECSFSRGHSGLLLRSSLIMSIYFPLCQL